VPSAATAVVAPLGDVTTTTGVGGAAGDGGGLAIGDGVACAEVSTTGRADWVRDGPEAAGAGCVPHAARVRSNGNPSRYESLIFIALVKRRPDWRRSCGQVGGNGQLSGTDARAWE
jgi:hypothetical protein